MISKSDRNSALILKYFDGKENWKAFKAEGGHINCSTNSMDTYVIKMDIFKEMLDGKKENFIRKLFNLAKGAYNRKVSQFKEYMDDKKD